MKSVPAAVFSLRSRFYLAALLAGLLAGGVRAADKNPDPSKKVNLAVLDSKPAPETVADLKAIQQQTKVVLKKVVPCTVGLIVGGASGSGVIIDKEGHILTAAHVSGKPEKTIIVILPNGKGVKAKSLGRNTSIDSGLIQITDKGTWSHVEMGKSAGLNAASGSSRSATPAGFARAAARLSASVASRRPTTPSSVPTAPWSAATPAARCSTWKAGSSASTAASATALTPTFTFPWTPIASPGTGSSRARTGAADSACPTCPTSPTWALRATRTPRKLVLPASSPSRRPRKPD